MADDLVIRAQLINEASRPLGDLRRDIVSTTGALGGSSRVARQASQDYRGLEQASRGAASGVSVQRTSVQGLHSDLGMLARRVAAVGLGKFAYDSVTGFQNAQVALKGLLGNQSEANKMIADLQAFAKETPFSFSGLLSQSQGMLAMGTSAKDLMPDLKSMADAVALMGGSNAQLQAVAVTMGQISNSPTLTSDNVRQLVESGHIDAYGILAKANDMSREQFTGQMQSGTLKITGQQAAKQLYEGFEAGAPDAAKKAAGTLSGQLSNLVDTANTQIGSALMPIVPDLTKAVQGMAQALPPLVTAATPFLHVLGDTLGFLADHPHLTEALAGFLIFREITGPVASTAMNISRMVQDISTLGSRQGVGAVFGQMFASGVGLGGGGFSAAVAASEGGGGLVNPLTGEALDPAALKESAAARAEALKENGRHRTGNALLVGSGVIGAAGAAYTINSQGGAAIGGIQGRFGHGAGPHGFGWSDAGKIGATAGKDAAAGAALGAAAGLFGGPLAPVTSTIGAAAGASVGTLLGLGTGVMGYMHDRGGYSRSDAGNAQTIAPISVNITSGSSEAELLAAIKQAADSPEMRAQINAVLADKQRTDRERLMGGN